MPLLTITDNEEILEPKKKPLVIATARVHPGESNGSFLIEGFIKFLVSSHPSAI